MTRPKARTVRWSARAGRDLDQIAAFIARDSPRAARRWIGQLRKAAERAARMPLAGRIVPEIERDDVREVFLRSYRIVYGIRNDHIFLFTVFRGGKQLSAEAVSETE